MRYAIITAGVVENVILCDADFAASVGAVVCESAGPGWAWDGAVFTAPPAVAAPVPQAVTKRQGRAALLLDGSLSLVQPAINAITDPIQRGLMQIEWDDSQEYERQRPAVILIGAAIGKDSAALDALFIAAAQL